jgi:hypothetical protein
MVMKHITATRKIHTAMKESLNSYQEDTNITDHLLK